MRKETKLKSLINQIEAVSSTLTQIQRYGSDEMRSLTKSVSELSTEVQKINNCQLKSVQDRYDRSVQDQMAIKEKYMVLLHKYNLLLTTITQNEEMTNMVKEQGLYETLVGGD